MVLVKWREPPSNITKQTMDAENSKSGPVRQITSIIGLTNDRLDRHFGSSPGTAICSTVGIGGAGSAGALATFSTTFAPTCGCNVPLISQRVPLSTSG